MNKQEFGELMAAMHAAYPGEKVTADSRAVALWYQELKETEYRTAAYALHRHIRTNRFPPAIAEILGTAEQKNRFNNFLPRNYDFAALERALLEVTDREARKIGKKEKMDE